MKSAPFTYHRPRSVPEALELKRELGGDARVLAGGQSLMPMMHFRLAQPAHLIDINGLDELAYVRQQDDRLTVGARTRHAELLEAPEATASPLLAQAVSWVGHAQVRHRGTVVGSIAHADPSAEIPAALLALAGEVTAASARGTRSIPATGLFAGPFAVSLEDDEIITSVSVPVAPAGTGTAFVEFSRIFHGFPVVGVAASVQLDTGVVSHAGVGLCGMAANAVAADVSGLVGSTPSAEAVEAVARAAVADLEPPADVHGSARYRKRVCIALIRRALAEAVTNAGGVR